MPVAVYRSGEQANILRFQSIADDTVDRISLRIGEHISLLEATRALFEAEGAQISQGKFASFVDHLDINNRFDGVQGIGFSSIVQDGQEEAVWREISSNYGVDRGIFPKTSDAAVRTAVIMLEPSDERNLAALGFDMYSESIRREAMQAAARSNEVRATTKVELVQEIDDQKQPGFLVYLPFFLDGGPAIAGDALPRNLRGFIYAPFRIGDLIGATLNRGGIAPVHMSIYLGEPTQENLVFESANRLGGFNAAYEYLVSVDVAGQTWHYQMQPSDQFREGTERAIAFLLASIMILMAAALALSLRSQMKALAASREVVRVTDEAAVQKDFLLQEMKHRIKNSIARVLAIARQTANHSESLEDFIASFTKRLQAMAAAQDLLTQSHHQTARLGDLLRNELLQVFDQDFDNYSIDGPKVDLGAKATQALALVFHELATNALKYADMANGANRLDIRWQLADDGRLEIRWEENLDAVITRQEGSGFGTRLIHSLVAGELGGQLRRELTENGLRLEISVPREAR
ncbi:CHASE domain-containing protein [Pseudohoeflea suaedae]|nr:CHASE domain-containing protein [Pseudohoeflea suaedae]